MNSDMIPLVQLLVILVGSITTLGFILGAFWFILAWEQWNRLRKLRKMTWDRWYTEDSIRREIEVRLAEKGFDFSDPAYQEYERKRLGAP